MRAAVFHTFGEDCLTQLVQFSEGLLGPHDWRLSTQLQNFLLLQPFVATGQTQQRVVSQSSVGGVLGRQLKLGQEVLASEDCRTKRTTMIFG